jgi:hypothetical protein
VIFVLFVVNPPPHPPPHLKFQIQNPAFLFLISFFIETNEQSPPDGFRKGKPQPESSDFRPWEPQRFGISVPELIPEGK